MNDSQIRWDRNLQGNVEHHVMISSQGCSPFSLSHPFYDIDTSHPFPFD